jgi:FkbM family methyltransferase
MGELRKKLQIYRQVFGPRGYWLALKTRLSAGPYEVVVHAPEGSIFLRLKTSDLNAYYKVILNEDYDFPLAQEPKVIVDAGANLGFASIYFARKYPSARIFAIEPERSNFELLQKNVRGFKNIVPIRGALWNEDGKMDLVDPGQGHWAFQIADQNAPGSRPIKKVETVPTFTVSTLMRNYQIESIDVFKIDIEGAEKELFEFAAEWIERVGSIMIELHDRFKSGCTDAFNHATGAFPLEQTRGENIFRSRSPSKPIRAAGPAISV